MTNPEYVAGLRKIADFYEANPSLTLPTDTSFTVYGYDAKEDVLKLVHMLGNCKKEFLESVFYIVKAFGGFKLKFCFSKSKVCERIVTGTKVIPSIYFPERIEEIVEWKCHPLLEETADTNEL